MLQVFALTRVFLTRTAIHFARKHYNRFAAGVETPIVNTIFRHRRGANDAFCQQNPRKIANKAVLSKHQSLRPPG
jgi:hypothetical protein